MTEPAAEAGDRPTDLRVEYEEAPENVDLTAVPRFSWRVATDRRGARQVAYRVVVGREREHVATGTGGLWDSGRVDARTATGVEYDGPAVGADETYWWSVTLWTDAGETAWADPVAFGTALAPEDWRGEWVAYQPGSGRHERLTESVARSRRRGRGRRERRRREPSAGAGRPRRVTRGGGGRPASSRPRDRRPDALLVEVGAGDYEFAVE